MKRMSAIVDKYGFLCYHSHEGMRVIDICGYIKRKVVSMGCDTKRAFAEQGIAVLHPPEAQKRAYNPTLIEGAASSPHLTPLHSTYKQP